MKLRLPNIIGDKSLIRNKKLCSSLICLPFDVCVLLNSTPISLLITTDSLTLFYVMKKIVYKFMHTVEVTHLRCPSGV